MRAAAGLLLLLAGRAAACGEDCYRDSDGNWECGWAGPDPESVPCHPLAFGQACGACGGHDGTPCTPLYDAAAATEFGVCSGGACVACASLTSEAACNACVLRVRGGGWRMYSEI